MSYEIYYDRAFIRVNDLYAPIVNQGSNNCWEYNFFAKRDVPEKYWEVLNWRDRSRLLYTEEEVREIAKDYERIGQESGTCFKSRHRPFAPGEFERWILCGLKSAFTIEEYVAAGNSLEINDFSEEKIKDWKLYPFSTTEEFLALIDTLKGRPLLNIHFGYNRQVYRPVKKPVYHERPEEYYVLFNGKSYFCKLARRSCYITNNFQNDAVRVFTTEHAAQKYLEKHEPRLRRLNFEARKIRSMELAS